mgnify:CR=1 FL=1
MGCQFVKMHNDGNNDNKSLDHFCLNKSLIKYICKEDEEKYKEFEYDDEPILNKYFKYMSDLSNYFVIVLRNEFTNPEIPSAEINYGLWDIWDNENEKTNVFEDDENEKMTKEDNRKYFQIHEPNFNYLLENFDMRFEILK